MNDAALVPYERGLPNASDATVSAEEMLQTAFSSWERRGRGWDLFDFPVELEPPFCPFYALLNAPEPPIFDDGRLPGFWSDLFGGRRNEAKRQAAALAEYRNQIAEYQSLVKESSEPHICSYLDAEFVELQIVLPKDSSGTKRAAENLIHSFSYLSCPISFEIIGTSAEIVIQFVAAETDAANVKAQIKAHLPEASIKEISGFLFNTWNAKTEEILIVDFGLSNEFFLPLKTTSYLDVDLLVSIVGALADLREDEVGVFQVLFQKTQNDWAQDAVRVVEYLTETGAYKKTSGAVRSVREKTKTPLYAACLRAAGKSYSETRAWRIVKSLAAGLAALADPVGNELIPLTNDGYPEQNREEALLERKTFRSGMLLNSDELAFLVHPPTSAVQSEKLRRDAARTKAAPALALNNRLILGENFHEGEMLEASLSNEQRTKHIHLIGASGNGKSTLMLNLIKQDLEANQGLCVIDPHGDLIDSVIESVPENRIKDVVLFDPSDAEFPVGFNILQANSELEKTLLSSDLVATFRRMSTSWGDVMDSVLANAILAFLESSRGGTLFDLKRFLIEKDFRSEFLNAVQDEAIRYFWQNEFPLIAGKPQASILIRLDAFLRQKLIRNIVCQKETRIDFRRIMDERKILLVKLAQGAIGEENSYLLGTLLMSKLYQTALSRQDTRTRPFFSCYLDEFHHFITPSMESVLSGVRKYNLGLVLAHQEFRQLQSRSQEVASSVLSNCYTRICFRLGDADAERFASGFSFFDAANLQNLSVGEAVARIERSDYDFNLKIDLPPKVSKETRDLRKREIFRFSREQFAASRAEVEAQLFTPQAKPASAYASAGPAGSAELPAEKSNPPKSATESLQKHPVETISEATGEHRYLQKIIKRIGENYDFVATLEKQVFGGIGKVDVALESENLKVAVEIAHTNSVEYELQNIQKCLASGFNKVVVISTDAKHLANIRRRTEAMLSLEQFGKVHFLEPENFNLFLEKLRTDSPVLPSDGKVKGYTINTEFKESNESDAKIRKQTVFEILTNAVKRTRKK